MKLIPTLILRSFTARPTRMLLSTFGIVLGVAAILGMGITNRTAMDAVKLLFEDTAGKSDLIVLSADAEAGGFSENLLAKVRRVPEVAYAVPSVHVRTALLNDEGAEDLRMSVLGLDPGGLQLYGVDPEIDTQVRSYEIGAGRFLAPSAAEPEIVLVDSYAEENSIQLGDAIEIAATTGIETLRVVGLMEKKGVGQTNNGAFGVVPILTAQKYFFRSNEIDQIDLMLQPAYTAGTDLDSLKTRIQQTVGREYSVIYPASQGQRMTQMLSNYQIGLNFLSGMALFVGAFLVYNAFSMSIVERTREFGMLRTAGMTRAQVIRLIITEALLLGIVGSILGAVAGILLAQGLSQLMGIVLSQDLSQTQLPQGLLMIGITVGVFVAVLSALLPALQAGRISPMEALRVRTKTRPGWFLRKSWIAGLFLLVFSAVLLILNPFPYDVQFRLGSLMVVCLFLGGTFIIPGTIGFWQRPLKPLIRIFFGRTGLIGSSNVQRAQLRTALTVAALMVGVAMMVVVWALTDSFKGDLDEWLQGYMGGDLIVSSPLALAPQVWHRLQSVEGVQAAAPVGYKTVECNLPGGESEMINLMAVDPVSYQQVTSFVFADSRTEPDVALNKLAQGESIFISTVLAEIHGVELGDMLTLRTKTGDHPFEVAAIIVDFSNQGYVATVSWTDMERYFREHDAQTLLIKLHEGYSPAEVGDRIEALYGDRYRLITVSNESLLEEVSILLDQAFSMFDVLALIAIIVGFFGIANTLTMNVMERTREIGMLRGVGMTRSQVIVMILAEAATLGLVGGVLGVLFGVILSRIFLLGMTAMSGYRLSYDFPLSRALVALLVAVLVSQLAALLPAGRAARTRILEAIQYE